MEIVTMCDEEMKVEYAAEFRLSVVSASLYIVYTICWRQYVVIWW